MDKQDFFDQIKALAHPSLPPAFIAAQAALESGWGQSEGAKLNNLFGIKADANWTGEWALLPTIEYQGSKAIHVMARFRQYVSWEASISDHEKFFQQNPRYKLALACTDPVECATAVAAAGYATDPNYATKLTNIIHQYERIAMPTIQPNSSANTALAAGGSSALLALVLWVCNEKWQMNMPPEVASVIGAGLATVGHAVYNKWLRNSNDAT